MVLQTMYPPQKDSPSTFLTGDIAATDTLINVGNSAVLPQTVPFPLTLGFDKSVTETVMVTAIGSGNNQLTVTRATGSLSWVTGTRCARVFTAADLKTLQDNMEAVNTTINGIGQPSVLDLAALKAIVTTTVVDKSMIFCESLGLYRFDSGSSATGDDYFVVVPTTGGGRWLMLAEVTHGTSNRFVSAGAIVDANGNELIKFPTKVASAVNEVTVSNNVTGNAPVLQASGGDTNVGMDIKTKGTGIFRAFVNNVISFVSDAAASAVNYLTFKSNVTGSAPQINATGTDTNIDINLVPKGTGVARSNGVEIATTTGAQTLTNKTLSSPTIGDLTNAQHDHTSAAEGGIVSHTSLSNIGTNTHAQIDTHIADTATPHGATSSATVSKIIIRDVNGRAQVSDPSAAADIATKAYVDARIDGESNKTSVIAATTANITLSGTQTIDGVAVVAGNRVLVKNQTTGSQNGIYIVAAGTWTRATDADISAEVKSGLFTFVQSGTVNGSNGFTLTTPDPITLGTTTLTFIQTSGAGQIVDGAGLSKTGNQLDVQVDNSTLEIVSDKLQLKAGATLTTPKLATNGFIADANGNELLKATAVVASAINEVTVKNAVTNSAPGFSATGGDTNIDFEIVPKGTGIFRSTSGATFGDRAAGTAGTNSFSSGTGNVASGEQSQAFGLTVVASGAYSHAEGQLTVASGIDAHAEGNTTKAYAHNSHAEGYLSQAGGSLTDPTIGRFAHAEGVGTFVYADASHSEGNSTSTYSPSSHTEGYATLACSGSLYVIIGYNDVAKTITLNAVTGLIVGDALVIKRNDLIATRAVISTISGFVVTITTAETITSAWTYAIKANTYAGAHAEGHTTISAGLGSHAEGNGVIASGMYAHAEGTATYALGTASHTECFATAASGFAHAEGTASLALSGTLFVVTAKDNAAKTVTLGSVSGLIVGDKLDIKLPGASPIFDVCITSINGLIVTLNATADISTATHVIKRDGSGQCLHVEGNNCIATGWYAHAEGNGSISTGQSSHAEGGTSIASGNNSHAGGYGCTSAGSSSFAHGYGVIANGSNQAVFGLYNVQDTTSLFIIGNGTSDSARANAMRVTSDGDVIAGDGLSRLKSLNPKGIDISPSQVVFGKKQASYAFSSMVPLPNAISCTIVINTATVEGVVGLTPAQIALIGIQKSQYGFSLCTTNDALATIVAGYCLGITVTIS